MFGSMFKMKVKPGKKEELINLMTDGSGHAPAGMRSAFMYDTGGDEVWGVAVFESEASYRANAASDAQNKEYEKARALLTADPEWHDGKVRAWPGNQA